MSCETPAQGHVQQQLLDSHRSAQNQDDNGYQLTSEVCCLWVSRYPSGTCTATTSPRAHSSPLAINEQTITTLRPLILHAPTNFEDGIDGESVSNNQHAVSREKTEGRFCIHFTTSRTIHSSSGRSCAMTIDKRGNRRHTHNQVLLL